MIELDRVWLGENPLPQPQGPTDKNARGRLLAVGGSMRVPGALRLTGEAAFRAGAGKVQLATVAPAALPLGIAFPEAAVIALPANPEGELGGEAGPQIAAMIERCDALLVGPGMGAASDADTILATLLDRAPSVPLVLDAAMLHAAGNAADRLAAHDGPVVLTPHPQEMAALMGGDTGEACAALAEAGAARFGATVVLKASETWIAEAGQPTLHYRGGGAGLATGGSGDVLAGIIGGLLARSVAPRVAAAWGVWLHGESGRRCAERQGAIGFLARELLPIIPTLIDPA
jgi:ADP-dependent NAD(P)H-hydrate dehydratase